MFPARVLSLKLPKRVLIYSMSLSSKVSSRRVRIAMAT
jgi:hypothetical protein